MPPLNFCSSHDSPPFKPSTTSMPPLPRRICSLRRYLPGRSMTIVMSPSMFTSPAPRRAVPLISRVLIAASLSSPPPAFPDSARIEAALATGSCVWPATTVVATAAATIDRAPARMNLMSTLFPPVRKPSLRGRKEFVKNVKASKSACYGDFPVLHSATVKIKWPAAPKVLTALLVVLLPVLAYMQYRWVGQVSEGERERMQRNLETSADQFRGDFDGEFVRAIRELTVGPTTAREGTSGLYTLRYTSWLNTADHPQVVADIYFVDAADNQLRLRRYNNGTHVFEPSLWPEELDRHRADFEAAYKDFQAQRESNRRIRTAFGDEESLLVSPLQNFEVRQPGSQPTVTEPVFGYTIIQLDESYLRNQMIPALAERHFTERGGEMYRVAVIVGDDSKRILYRSSPDATTDVGNAD